MQISKTYNHNAKEACHPGHRDGFKPQRRKRGQFNLIAFCMALCLLARG